MNDEAIEHRKHAIMGKISSQMGFLSGVASNTALDGSPESLIGHGVRAAAKSDLNIEAASVEQVVAAVALGIQRYAEIHNITPGGEAVGRF